MTRAQDDLARLLDGDDAGRAPTGTGPLLAALALARQDLDGPTSVRPEFRDALRTRLLAVAAVQPEVPAPARPAPVPLLRSVRARRRLTALSAALAGVVALSGVGVAASRSVPGDLFYAAKRTAEDVRLGVAGGDRTEQGLRRLQRATARLSELEVLAQAGRPLGLAASRTGVPLAAGASRAQVVDVLDDMDEDVRDGSRLMLDGFRADGDPASLVLLRDWSVEQAARLRALLPELGAALLPRVEGSLALVRGVEASAVQLLGAPSPTGPGPLVAGSPAPGAGPSAGPEQPGAEQAGADEPGSTQVDGGPVDSGQVDSGQVDSGQVDSGQPGLQQPGTGPRPTSPVQEQVPVPGPGADLDEPPVPRPTAELPLPDLPGRGTSTGPALPEPPTVPLPSPVLPSLVVPQPVLPSVGLPAGGLPLPTPPARRVPVPGRSLPGGLPGSDETDPAGVVLPPRSSAPSDRRGAGARRHEQTRPQGGPGRALG